MLVVSLLPQIYALILVLLHPWQINALRKRLESTHGEHKPSVDWIETAIFDDVMWELVKAPTVAILPTLVTTLQRGSLELAGITILILMVLGVIFGLLKSLWKPWDLNRTRRILGMQLSGHTILIVGKVTIVLISMLITIFA